MGQKRAEFGRRIAQSRMLFQRDPRIVLVSKARGTPTLRGGKGWAGYLSVGQQNTVNKS